MDGKELWSSYVIYAILGGVSGLIANVGFVFIGILAMSEGFLASELFQLGSIIGGVVGLFGGLLGGRIGKRYNRGYLGAPIGGAVISLLGYCLFMYIYSFIP